jgi:hypothetical protein
MLIDTHAHLVDDRLRGDLPAVIQRALAAGVEPFKPGFQLWSDGAEKSRFIALPPGTKIESVVERKQRAEQAARLTGRPVSIIHTPMRPGEDERSVVLGNPDTLLPLGMDGSDFISLNDGVGRAIDYFANYLWGEQSDGLDHHPNVRAGRPIDKPLDTVGVRAD